MTPLLLVAGFLGAGKTTFLRSLLPALAARGLRPRVILNDFQNARVDAATLTDLAPELVALDGDCVCCETFADLMKALTTMDLGPAQVVIVETNGTTDTGVLLELLGGEASLDRLSPPMQLTVVDGQRFANRGWQNTMEEEQIQTASHVLLSRLDLIPTVRAAEVQLAVGRLAPRALPVTAESLAEDLARLEPAIRGQSRRAVAAGGRVEGPPGGGASHPHHHGGGHARHHFASMQIPLDGPVDELAFLTFLRELPPEILRAKGIVELRDPPGQRRSFQKVDSFAEISPCQLAEPEAVNPVAVFVGPAIPEAEVRARLTRLWQR